MQLCTKHFGNIEIDENKVITFEDGIPGFEYIKKFILLETEDKESPFQWLQCVDRPEYAFVIVNPYKVLDEYIINISESDVELLSIECEDDAAIFCIVVIPEDVNKMTTNLKAPVIINTRLKKGKQVLLDNSNYSIRHYLMNQSK